MSVAHPNQSTYNESPRRGSFILSLRSKFETDPESPSRSRRLLLKFTSDKKSRRMSNASTVLLKSQYPIKSTLRMSIAEAARSPLRSHIAEPTLSVAFKSRDDLPASKRLSLDFFNLSKASKSDPSLPLGRFSRASFNFDSQKNISPTRSTRLLGSFSSISTSAGGDLELSFEYSEDEDTNPTETSFEDLSQTAKSGDHAAKYQYKQSSTMPAGLATILNDFDTLDDARFPRGPIFGDVNYDVLKVLAPLFESIRIIDPMHEVPAYDFDSVDVTNCFAEPYYS